jgi:glutamate racemase
MWVPLIENNEQHSPGADYFIKKNIDNLINKQPNIDTVVLGCTHYPLIEEKIKSYLPKNIHLLSQGAIIAKSLKNYLIRHPEIDDKCSKTGRVSFFTTDLPETFDKAAGSFYGNVIFSKHLNL